MQTDEKVFINRLYDLAENACSCGKYRFTAFLGLHEQALLHREENNLQYAGLTLFGGAEGCERVVAAFGSRELCGYELQFPVTLLQCTPVNSKFADKLSHRDVLGALMGLGIERDTVGDIFLIENTAFVFVLSHMAEMICRELCSAKHTSLRCEIISSLPAGMEIRLQEQNLLVASERADCIVAAVFSLSRETAAELFRQDRIFADGRLLSASRPLTEGCVVSVRGYGRFRYGGISSVSKKGKLRILAYLYA